MSNTLRHLTLQQQVSPANQVNIAATTTNSEGITTTRAIADTGATAIFIMEGVPVDNKRVAVNPLTINLPNGTKVRSTHECDVTYPGLPTTLTGHIVPDLAISSLVGIRVLCNAGCTVTFTKNYCDVKYKDNIIIHGHKNPATDLWTLPITSTAETTIPTATDDSESLPHSAMFTHSIKHRANNVKFAHQSLGSPKISKLLQAVRKGFLKGCPYKSEELILKYLNASPATAKGHMKRPRQGIKSTTPKPRLQTSQPSKPSQPSNPPVTPIPAAIQPHAYNNPTYNIIADDSDASIANVFCFGNSPIKILE